MTPTAPRFKASFGETKFARRLRRKMCYKLVRVGTGKKPLRVPKEM